jgi:hypothetical protein
MPQVEAERRVDHVIDSGPVEAARDGLLLIERAGVVPRGNFGLNPRTQGPAD